MTHSPKFSKRGRTSKGGRRNFKAVDEEETFVSRNGEDPFKEVFEGLETPKPWPYGINVSADFSLQQQTPKGTAVKMLTFTSMGLLIGITLFAMITRDREMLFAVLTVIKYFGLSLAAWALGSVVTKFLPERRGNKEDGDKEERSG